MSESKCPKCKHDTLRVVGRQRLDGTSEYMLTCDRCDWEGEPMSLLTLFTNLAAELAAHEATQAENARLRKDIHRHHLLEESYNEVKLDLQAKLAQARVALRHYTIACPELCKCTGDRCRFHEVAATALSATPADWLAEHDRQVVREFVRRVNDRVGGGEHGDGWDEAIDAELAELEGKNA